MIRYRFILVPLLLCLALVSWTEARVRITSVVLGTPPLPAITHVQSCFLGTGGGGASFNCTFASNVTTGNLIACLTQKTGSLSETVTLADPSGNTYDLRTGTGAPSGYTDDPTTPMRVASFRAKNVIGGSAIVTATWTGPITERGILCHEIHNAHTSTPDDGFIAAFQTGVPLATDAISTGALTPSVNGVYFFVAGHNTNNNCIFMNPGTDFTGVVSTGCNPKSEYLIQTTAATHAGTFTPTDSGHRFVSAMQLFRP